MKNELQKALEAIEEIVSDDFAEGLMYSLIESEGFLSPTMRIACEKIEKIYIISHAFNEHSCHGVHDNWRDQVLNPKL